MSSPEAEETRSLSSNLFKAGTTCITETAARVIDSDALMTQRPEVLGRTMPKPADKDGFSQGFAADVLDVLTTDEAALTAAEAQAQDGTGQAEEPSLEEPSLEELRKQAMEEIAGQKAEAEALLAAERQKTLEEAKRQGYQEGMTRALQEVEGQKQLLMEQEKQLTREYEELIAQLEPRFIETLTGIYEHIFHVELSGYRDIIVCLIADALRKTEGGRDYIVHVSKEDYPYVSMQKKQITAGGGSSNTTIELVEDVTLAKNQALIETDSGIFDCSLGTQLSELRQRLALLSYEKPAEE